MLNITPETWKEPTDEAIAIARLRFNERVKNYNDAMDALALSRANLQNALDAVSDIQLIDLCHAPCYRYKA